MSGTVYDKEMLQSAINSKNNLVKEGEQNNSQGGGEGAVCM